MRRTVRGSGLLAISLALAACNGNGDGGRVAGPDPDAPEQLSFQVRALTAERPGITVRYATAFALRDRNDDLLGGRAEIRSAATGQVVGFTLAGGSLAGDCTTRCTGAGVFSLTPSGGGRLDLVHYVVDAAGHRSNEIPFFVTIAPAELPSGGGAPSESRLSGYESSR
jgi:hypothetical protein